MLRRRDSRVCISLINAALVTTLSMLHECLTEEQSLFTANMTVYSDGPGGAADDEEEVDVVGAL